MFKCNKCGAVFGKNVESCFYCGSATGIVEVEPKEFEEEQLKKYETSQDTTQEEEKPKKKSRKKKS